MRHLLRAFRTRTTALVCASATQSIPPRPTNPIPPPPTTPPLPPRCNYVCERWIEANEFGLASMETRLSSYDSRVQKFATEVKRVEASLDEVALLIDGVDVASLELLHAAPMIHRIIQTWIETQERLKPPPFRAVLHQQLWVAPLVSCLNIAAIWLLQTVFSTEQGMVITAIRVWLSTLLLKGKKNEE